MSIKVNLYSKLRNYTNGQEQVEVRGSTVGQCLDDLVRQYPAIQPVLFDNNGRLHSIVFVSVNMSSINPEKLDRTLTGQDELFIILIIAGG